MPTSSSFEPPEQIGPYRILRRLGQGGMGTVYDALDTTLERRVALKVITRELADDPRFRTRFVHEARAQAAVDSPHVVQVFAHGEVDGRLFIATQLLPDGDLGHHLRRHGGLPVRVAAELVAQVADGLAEAHRVGLVHRDIKASNVLLRHRGTETVAYLADFGIAGPTGADGVNEDVRALGNLVRAAVAGPRPRELERVLARAGSVAEVRDGLRSLARTGRRPLRDSTPAAALVAAAAVTAVLVAVGVPGRHDRTTHHDDRSVARIARELERTAGLDPASASCTARRLLDEHGPDALAADPAAAVDVAASCLWRPRP